MMQKSNDSKVFAGLGVLCFAIVAAMSYSRILQWSQKATIKAEIEKTNSELTRMPTVKAEEMGIYCLICMTNPSNVVLIPCNHLCICHECFAQYKQSQQNGVHCPICRIDVDLNHQLRIDYDKSK